MIPQEVLDSLNLGVLLSSQEQKLSVRYCACVTRLLPDPQPAPLHLCLMPQEATFPDAFVLWLAVWGPDPLHTVLLSTSALSLIWNKASFPSCLSFFLASSIVIPVPAGSFRVWWYLLFHGFSFQVWRLVLGTNSWVALLGHLFGFGYSFTCVPQIKHLLLKSKEGSTSVYTLNSLQIRFKCSLPFICG